MSRPKRPKSQAARALKRANRYLTPLLNAAGAIVGYRFAPGPHLRAAGASSQILRHGDNGAYFSIEEARRFRDAAIDKAEGRAAAPEHVVAPRAKPVTLRQLWSEYEAATAAAIAKNEALPPAKRDADTIKPGTLRFYRSTIKPWLDYAVDEDTGEDLPAAALDGELIEEEYKRQKLARSHHSAAASLAALQSVFAYGVKRKRVSENPTLKLGFSSPPGRLRLAAPEEVTALVDAADRLAAEANDPETRQRFAAIGDAVVAAVWTAQRQADLLDCDLGRQLQRDGDDQFLIFAKTYDEDFSQSKTGGQAQVQVLPPLAERLNGREIGRLVPAANGARWNAVTFRDYFATVRAAAAEALPSVADLQFRDLRDTAITRLDAAEIPLTKIALWSGHSLKTIGRILQKHYLVATRAAARAGGERFEAWRQRMGIKY